MSQKDIEMSEEQIVDKSADGDEPKSEPPKLDSELANIIEAALYAAKEPLGIKKLISLFPENAQPTKVDIQNVILTLEEQCQTRGVELRRIGKGWRYQTKEKYAPWLRKLSGQKLPRYSRALLETLSIIAYRQPVTRGDIEDIRGVGVSSETIRTLEERGWIAQVGNRDVPGRPALFGTSQGFLEYFNMTSLSDLPELMDKRDLQSIAQDMNLTLPMDGVESESDMVEADEIKQDVAQVIELRPSQSSIPEVSAQSDTDDAELSESEADLGVEADKQTSSSEQGSDDDLSDESE